MMAQRLGPLFLVVMLVGAMPAAAQDDPWAGSWRGTVTAPGGDIETTVTMTLVAESGSYTGLLTGFAPGAEVRLTSIETGDDLLTIEAAADTALGPLALTYSLTRGERPRPRGRGTAAALDGPGRITLGDHGFDVEVSLTRARRTDIPQPQVEQRIGYFSGRWTFDYTGGEFPPLSVGTRSGTVTFTEIEGGPFVEGHLEAELYGEAYTETWTIGFDEDSHGVVWQEQPSEGPARLAVGDWSSPIGITFVTLPLDADGSTYVLRRLLQVTSETSFSVTDEFSIDGGAFRRLGNGAFLRAN